MIHLYDEIRHSKRPVLLVLFFSRKEQRLHCTADAFIDTATDFTHYDP